jgi:hypothetical protein
MASLLRLASAECNSDACYFLWPITQQLQLIAATILFTSVHTVASVPPCAAGHASTRRLFCPAGALDRETLSSHLRPSLGRHLHRCQEMQAVAARIPAATSRTICRSR